MSPVIPHLSGRELVTISAVLLGLMRERGQIIYFPFSGTKVNYPNTHRWYSPSSSATVLVTGRLICHCQAPCCIKRRNSVLPGRADYKIMERAVASPQRAASLKTLDYDQVSRTGSWEHMFSPRLCFIIGWFTPSMSLQVTIDSSGPNLMKIWDFFFPPASNLLACISSIGPWEERWAAHPFVNCLKWSPQSDEWNQTVFNARAPCCVINISSPIKEKD